MRHTVNLQGTRGDEFMAAIPLRHRGPPARALTEAEVQTIQAAWPNLLMQVKRKATDPDALIALSSTSNELRIEASYPLPDGTTGPALVIHASASKMTHTLEPTSNRLKPTDTVPGAVYDIQFSGPGSGPFTWVGGSFTLWQDVTHESG